LNQASADIRVECPIEGVEKNRFCRHLRLEQFRWFGYLPQCLLLLNVVVIEILCARESTTVW
jgi:hypothetical protein